MLEWRYELVLQDAEGTFGEGDFLGKTDEVTRIPNIVATSCYPSQEKLLLLSTLALLSQGLDESFTMLYDASRGGCGVAE